MEQNVYGSSGTLLPYPHTGTPRKRSGDQSGSDTDFPPPLIDEYGVLFHDWQSSCSANDDKRPQSDDEVCWACEDTGSGAQHPIEDHSVECQERFGYFPNKGSKPTTATPQHETRTVLSMDRLAPLMSMDETIQKMAERHPLMIGIKESIEKRYHLHQQILIMLRAPRRTPAETRLLNEIICSRSVYDYDVHPIAPTILSEHDENEYFELSVMLDCD